MVQQFFPGPGDEDEEEVAPEGEAGGAGIEGDDIEGEEEEE